MQMHTRLLHAKDESTFTMPRFCGLLCLVTWAILATAPAPAQDSKPSFLLNYEPGKERAEKKGSLALRPNIEQGIYFFVHNPTNESKKVTVVVGGIKSAVTLVPKQATEPVLFAKPGPDQKPVWLELAGPPFKMQVQLLDEANKELEQKDVAIDILTPPEYVAVSTPQFSSAKEGDQNQLTVQVAIKPGFDFVGPPSWVELVLRQRASGLSPIGPLKDADLRAVLTKAQPTATLFARNLKFPESAREGGEFSLTVDGYEEAFIFNADFRQVGEIVDQKLEGGARLRPLAARYWPAGSKLPVHLEAYKIPELDALLELDLGLTKDGKFEKAISKTFSGCREQHVRWSASSPDGALLVRTEIHDWNTELDTAGIAGERELRLQARKKQDKSLLAEGAAPVTLDSTPPEGVQLLGLPAKAPLGTGLVVQATGNDPESGIREVVFFVGKPPADGKLPPTVETVPGTPLTAKQGVWTGSLLLPADKKGPTFISTRFTNGAGMHTFALASLVLFDPADIKGSSGTPLKPGRIQGKVVEGPLPQANLEVLLRDDKGVEKDRAKTKEDGTFLFENVAPGAYRVSTAKSASRTKGEQPVRVKADETEKVEIKLYR
jgi:hypothetical protein